MTAPCPDASARALADGWRVVRETTDHAPRVVLSKDGEPVLMLYRDAAVVCRSDAPVPHLVLVEARRLHASL